MAKSVIEDFPGEASIKVAHPKLVEKMRTGGNGHWRKYSPAKIILRMRGKDLEKKKRWRAFAGLAVSTAIIGKAIRSISDRIYYEELS